ncbi:MAG: caspase family protein [Candidatus Binatia bacterium]
MTLRGLLIVVSGGAVAGLLMTWAVYRPGQTDSRAQRFAPAVAVPDTSGPARSTLWLLAIGVSRYKDADLNLQFAASDARAIDATLLWQGKRRLYDRVRTLVLTDEKVTRESILDSMERFLGRAGPNDVVVIFFAGHGVQDLNTNSYYFLPYPATPDNLLTAGLRMSDFDEMVRVLRRDVRGVVVMLDTCHAGALQLAAHGLVSADYLGMSVGEGFFLLAATKPGEDSKEEPQLAHGVFTYAVLEGLQGRADADGDGLVSLSELFGYVARVVPRLTGAQQHPYHKMEGTDLMFAAVPRGPKPTGSPPTAASVAQAAPEPASEPATNSIGVMAFRNLRADPQHDWIGKALRVAFNTELSKVRALHVYSPELIDRIARARGLDNLYVARQLGIGRLVTGSFNVVGNTIRIDAWIINATTGVQEGSDSVEGRQDDFFALQKKLVISMLRRLPVELSPEERKLIRTETNTDVDAYRLLLETEGVVERQTPPRARATPPLVPGPTAEPQSRREQSIWRFAFRWGAAAYAAEPTRGTVEADVRDVLEQYRGALEDKDVDRLAALYVSFSARRRDALRAYLQNASGLTVQLSDVTIAPHAEGVAVSYTRRDRFIDQQSGKSVRLEVRLTKILVRDAGQWKIAGGVR